MLNVKMLTLAIVTTLICTDALAQGDTLGFVKTVEGEATVITNAQSHVAQPGTPLYWGSILKTGETGRMGVTFKDNTILSFGPDTEVTIDEYLYAPAKDELKLVANLTKGTLQYISGVIAKLKPTAVSIKTPIGINLRKSICHIKALRGIGLGLSCVQRTAIVETIRQFF